MTDAKPYQIRGTLQTLLALRVERPDAPAFFELLREDVLRAPGFFKNAPVVLDVQPILAQSPLDLRKFIARVRACEL
ncbi:MAG: septum site-determining protein MinC, partial [Alphaproteobacteria bacterium]